MSRHQLHGPVLGLLATLWLAWAAPFALAGESPAIMPPLPVWPSDYETITDRRPTFRLNGRWGATQYRVEVARSADFTDPVVLAETQTTDTTGITPVILCPWSGKPLTDGQYYWRTFAENDSGFRTPPANYRTFFVSGQDRDAVKPAPDLRHPYLLVSADELPALRDRIARNEHLSRGWNWQVNAAYSALELTPPGEDYAKAGEGQHGNYSTAAGWYHRHLENVAFVAFVNGDGQLARKGVEMLMTACSYQRWLGPLFDDTRYFDPPWKAALETAMMTESVAIGYDLLYPHLTEAQREEVRNSIAEKGVRLLVHDWADPIGSSQLPRHQTPTGNWVMVCSSSGGLGALAILNEHPEAPQWARLVRNRARAWLHDRGGDWFVDNPNPQNRPRPIPVIGPSEPNFGIDGGYKESIGYMCYGTRYVFFFADAFKRMGGEDLYQHVPATFLNPLAWSIMAWREQGEIKSSLVDFGDEGGGTAWYGDLLAASIKHRHDELAAWLYRRINPVANTPRSLLWYDQNLKEQPPQSDTGLAVFRTIGQVYMRSGWSPDSPLAAIKFHQNRGHFDIGGFFLFGGGGPTLIDSGSAHYGGEIYRKFLSTTAGHNVIMVDDKPQTRTDGELLGAVGTGLISAASGQLRAAYPDVLESWTRDLVMLPEGLVLIHDVLKAKSPHRFNLILHPEQPFEIKEGNELSIGSGGARARVRVFATLPVKPETREGYHRTLSSPCVHFKAAEPATAVSFLTLCEWTPSAETQRAEVTALPQGGWSLSHKTASATAESWASDAAPKDCAISDARLVVELTTREGQRHALLIGGTRLKPSGSQANLSLRTEAPVMAAVREPGEWDIWPAAQTRMEITPQAGTVRLNGQRVTDLKESASISFVLPAGPNRVTAGPAESGKPTAPPADLLALPAADAPAFHEGVRTRSSSSWTDGVDALDGDVNTSWMSLGYLPMPQWLEIDLPRPETMNRLDLNTRLPCAGRAEIWDEQAGDWKTLGNFETTAATPAVALTFERRTGRRIKVTVERIDPANSGATIASLTWSDEKDR